MTLYLVTSHDVTLSFMKMSSWLLDTPETDSVSNLMTWVTLSVIQSPAQSPDSNQTNSFSRNFANVYIIKLGTGVNFMCTPQITVNLKWTTHHCQQLLDFIHCSLEFESCSVLGVLDCDQNVELVVEMLPVGFAPVLFLLKHWTDINNGQWVRRPILYSRPGQYWAPPGGVKMDKLNISLQLTAAVRES